MNFSFVLKSFFLFILFTSCVFASGKDLVIVSIPPMQYLMQEIAGNEIEVRSLIGSSDNAELYEPTPRQLHSLGKAVLYFPLSLPFERKWLAIIKENNQTLLIADCCEDLMQSFVDNKHSHHHVNKDPHIWTDPLLNREIALRMRDALIDLFPVRKKDFTENYKQLDKELVSIHEEIISLSKSLQNKIFIVSHPAWTYFSERYDFKQIPLEYEGKEIGIRSTIELVELAKEKNIDTIFVQRQIKSNPAIALASEINAEIVELDPLALDHLNNLRLTARLISDSIQN